MLASLNKKANQLFQAPFRGHSNNLALNVFLRYEVTLTSRTRVRDVSILFTLQLGGEL